MYQPKRQNRLPKAVDEVRGKSKCSADTSPLGPTRQGGTKTRATAPTNPSLRVNLGGVDKLSCKEDKRDFLVQKAKTAVVFIGEKFCNGY